MCKLTWKDPENTTQSYRSQCASVDFTWNFEVIPAVQRHSITQSTDSNITTVINKPDNAETEEVYYMIILSKCGVNCYSKNRLKFAIKSNEM